MTASTISVRNAAGTEKLLASDVVDDVHTPLHREAEDQREALLESLAGLSTEAKLEAVRALLAVTLADAQTVAALADGAGVRQAVGTSSAPVTLPTLGASRRVRINASTRCWVRFGTSGSVTASVAGTSIPFEANSPEYVVVPAGMTHFAVIRDSADGFVHIQPTVT